MLFFVIIFSSKGGEEEAIDETTLKMLLENILEAIGNVPLYQEEWWDSAFPISKII